MSNIINQRIRKYRKEKKFSQARLAAELGIKTSTYSQKEREGNFSADMVLQISRVLGINPSLIFYGEETAAPKPQTFVFHSPNTIEETLYGTTPKTEPVIEKIEQPRNELPFILNNTEKNVITAYHHFSKAEQKEVRAFMDEIRKRGR